MRGDRDELIRVFENLIENALKYGGSGKQVDVRFTRGQGADGAPDVGVAVRDIHGHATRVVGSQRS